MVIFTADYDQVELRVIAALANEQAMIDAAKKGESLHKLAAERLFGMQYVPDQYKLAKNINFTYAFAGGADTMATRYEITLVQARALIADYEKAFPALARYKRWMTESILHSALSTREFFTYKVLRSKMFAYRNDTPEGRAARATVQTELRRLCRNKTGFVITPFGRRIIVDAEKPYTAINYMVQTSARDIMGQGLLNIMDDPELEPTVLLPIHDEVLGQGPVEEAEQLCKAYAEKMTTTFLGVPITASGKVYGKSWGHGYRRES